MRSEGSRIHSIDYMSQLFLFICGKETSLFFTHLLLQKMFLQSSCQIKKVLDQSQDDLVN